MTFLCGCLSHRLSYSWWVRNTRDYSDTGRKKVIIKLWFENCNYKTQMRVHVQKNNNHETHALNQTHR